MLITIQTATGPKKVNVCEYCKTVCIPTSQRYCSGHCARGAATITSRGNPYARPYMESLTREGADYDEEGDEMSHEDLVGWDIGNQ